MEPTEAPKGGLEIHPLEQFEVTPLFGDGEVGLFTVTNSTLWMAVIVAAISLTLILSMRGRALVPTRMQSITEMIYGFIRQMVADVNGEDGAKYFPYIFTLFIFVLFANLIALIPYTFTVTSHVAVTGVMALVVFVTVTTVGFMRHGLGFLKLFWVESAPLPLRFFLLPIELISYFVRPVSHSIRLAGNMMAGHAVLEVFGAFVGVLGIAGVLPIAAMVGIYGLELLVAVVQAYIFAILTAIYLNDALHLH